MRATQGSEIFHLCYALHTMEVKKRRSFTLKQIEKQTNQLVQQVCSKVASFSGQDVRCQPVTKRPSFSCLCVYYAQSSLVTVLCLCLTPALLDLPVQASATEVLGFGQTANASPSGLPFRFYEQSRRAPNDPTANRSVFASVDKVPGEEKKRLVCNTHWTVESLTSAIATTTQP